MLLHRLLELFQIEVSRTVIIHDLELAREAVDAPRPVLRKALFQRVQCHLYGQRGSTAIILMPVTAAAVLGGTGVADEGYVEVVGTDNGGHGPV